MGVIRFVTNKLEFIRAKNEAIEAALEALGIEAEKYAKLHLDQEPRRIDTGRLRNSISHAARRDSGATFDYKDNKGNSFNDSKGEVTSKDTVYVGTNVEYAPYVEFGTVNMAPNHFLKSAASEHTERYIEIVKKYLKNN